MIRPLAFAALALLPTLAASRPAAALEPARKSEIEAVVRDYLVAHPEVILEALDAMEAKRAAATAEEQKAAIASAADDLHATPDGTALGNAAGDVTVVEFFDYNCGYCRHALGDMNALIKDDPKLRFVLKEIPVLGPDSVAATHVSLAVRALRPDLYADFHRKLLGSKGLAGEDSALDVAESLGIPEEAVRRSMDSDTVRAAMEENDRLAQLLKINGTPSYVMGDEIVPGAIGRDALRTKIGNLRACGRTAC